MTGDAYPAVRHLAWRALERLGVDARDYDPSDDVVARADVVAHLAGDAVRPSPARVARLRAHDRDDDIEIGE